MSISNELVSTGLPGLDRVFRKLMPGDNVVWHVDSIEDYKAFVSPYVAYARETEKKLVYFSFNKHEPLVGPEMGADVHEINPEAGFETFIGDIHDVIRKAGYGAFYVFDCISDLAVDWYSDQMLGNFFQLTCPYLYDLETLAYFGLRRNSHSSHAASTIAETTQLFLDVYRYREKLYVRPRKVQQRNTPLMFMLHVWEGDDFLPVTDSVTTSEILASSSWSGVESAGPELDIWNRTLRKGEEVLHAIESGEAAEDDVTSICERLLRMIVSRDDRVMGLARRFLSLSEILDVAKRMIGTGLVGGKSVGMLLAHAILKQKSERWAELLEVHDSFFLGSDVFYTFLVQNGCWWVRQEQRDAAALLANARSARQRILTGNFPDHITKQFWDMLDYFGQSPFIVRSSSLLEDNFGNAFAGNYESYFCANQGSRDKRLQDFLSAVRAIYASTMSEKAIMYRDQRGILDRDEQMALLVQRVSGSLHKNLFFPQIAGVGFSFNPYVWSEDIESEAGVLRLVFGMGTRAVDRSDDDYTRVVALNAPERRPETTIDATRKFAQRSADVLDLEANLLVPKEFTEIAAQCPDLPLRMVATRDEVATHSSSGMGGQSQARWLLTFDRLLTQTSFAEDFRDGLRILQDAYEHPVDVEFTANLTDNDEYRINVVQCRPFQVKGGGAIAALPADIRDEDVIARAHGPVIGHSRLETIDRLIYVVPSVYAYLRMTDRYSIARLIGRLTHLDGEKGAEKIILFGPGRWGTTTPSLGVPVSFAEINSVAAVCEIVAMRDDLIPEVSFGTHFFNNLIEMDILFIGLFPNRENDLLNEGFFDTAPNRLTELVPSAEEWAHAVRVIDVTEGKVRLNANTLKQEVVCYSERGEAGA